MTASVLVQVWLFVVAAFGLGLLVGWMFWRFHRSSQPIEGWRAEQAELVAQRSRLAQLAAERDALIEQVAQLRSETSRLALVVTDSWQEREAARRRAAEIEATAARLRAELEHVTARAGYLQRRATEWTVTRSRNDPVDGGGGEGFDGRAERRVQTAVQQGTGSGGLASPR